MPSIHFLTQNGPGPRMGMGHYERLLFQYLIAESDREEWQFALTCDGRVTPEAIRADGSFPAAFEPVGGMGVSSARLQDMPWPAVRAAMNLRFASNKPDLFHSLALSLPAPGSRPAVYTIHDLPPARFSDEGRLPKWMKQAARDAALIVTPSEFAKREVIELLETDPTKVQVVPNGLEHQKFNLDVPVASADTLNKLGIEGPFFIYAGGHSQRKNVPALLDAWKIIARCHPELTLVLAGPKGLADLARQHDVPRVLPLGYVSREVLPGLMRASRALICPSIYEGFGLPPLEAMAMGVPVIGSSAGGAVPEVVAEAGLLARDGSAEAIAEAIETFMADPDLEARMRARGPKRAQEYSWTTHARTILELYRSVITSVAIR